MKCCYNCFSKESGIRAILSDYISDHGKCDFCGEHDVDLIETKELIDVFAPLLDIYIISSEGESISESIDRDWLCFERLELSKAILTDMIKGNTKYSPILNNSVTLLDSILKVQNDWEMFCNDIKHSNRFFVNNTLPIITDDNIFLNQQVVIKRGHEFYRARTTNQPKALTEKEMRNPPIEHATPGRANPEGISYLYLANDIDTIMYESRSSYLDYVSVAKFKANRDLKVVSLNSIQKIDPFTPDVDLQKLLYNTKLLKIISDALSNPLRNFESKIEYVPTQYICEFIKSLGFDGINYSSAMHRNGLNYAFFSGNAFDIVDIKLYEISDSVIKYRRI